MSVTAPAQEERSLIDQLRDRRTVLLDEIRPLIENRETERSQFEAREASETEAEHPSDEERAAFNTAEDEFRALLAERRTRVQNLTARIDEQELEELRKAEAARASQRSARITVESEPLTYRRDNARDVSYYRDFALVSKPATAASFRHATVDEARERLHAHGREMDVEMPKRSQQREERARRQADEAERAFTGSFIGGQRRGLTVSPFERRVNPNRTEGQGGYFVPPLWLIDEYIPLLRAGRVAANLCRNLDLPPGTDSINIPKLASGTATAVQTADASAVQDTDFTDTSVQANVKTVAGQQDVAIQLLDQSPGQIIDMVITEDLMADFNRLIDRQVVYGNGTNAASLNGGQVLGIYPSANWPGTNVITWTEAAPVNGAHFIQVLGAMASQAAYSRFSLENFHFLLHPRRWFWYATTLDTTGRPIVESPRGQGMNIAATEAEAAPTEGLAGSVAFGPNAYISGNVPTTDTSGGGTGQDIAIGAKWDDLWLFESEPRTRVLEEVLSGTLEVRFQMYGYIGFLVRYGQSIAIAEGSAFAAPTGADTSVVF